MPHMAFYCDDLDAPEDLDAHTGSNNPEAGDAADRDPGADDGRG